VDETGVYAAAWSDDDEMLAVGVHHFEIRASQRNEGSDARRRKRCRQVYMLPADMSLDPEPITDCESGGTDFYLMAEAGYLLVVWYFSDHTEIRQYTLDGEWTKIADSRDEPAIVPDGYVCSLNGIPSPDGGEIAISFQCDTIPSGDSRAQLRIVDGDSGAELLPRTDVRSVAGGIWTPAGDFIWGLQSIKPDTVQRWSPGASELDIVPTPSCTWPPTTSGIVSENGVIVATGESLDDPVRFGRQFYPGVPDEQLQPFGCP